jgi:hypothetical protein
VLALRLVRLMTKTPQDSCVSTTLYDQQHYVKVGTSMRMWIFSIVTVISATAAWMRLCSIQQALGQRIHLCE